MRFGVVHRMARSDEHLDGGVFGTSVFFQENLERGHARIVTGLDYADRWGTGSLTYYLPVTDWKSGRLGFEERALAGLEFELHTAAARTIEFTAAAGYWERRDGSGDWDTRGRLGVGWQPHRWLGLRAGWDDVGTPDDSFGLHALLAIPFGGADRPRVRSDSPSRAEFDSGGSGSGSLWTLVDNVGSIQIAEREASPTIAQTKPNSQTESDFSFAGEPAETVTDQLPVNQS